MTRYQYKMPVNKLMDDKIDKRKKEKEKFMEKFKTLKLKKVSTNSTKEWIDSEWPDKFSMLEYILIYN